MRTVAGLALDPLALTDRAGMAGRLRAAFDARWPPLTLEARFWSHVDKSGECWLWTGSRNARGYGHFGVGNRRSALAHRVSWVFANRPLGPGELVLHKQHCTSKSCVRPDHLYVGDQKQNMADANALGLLKGRNVARGEDAGQATLTDQQVREIVTRYICGEGSSALGAEYGVKRDHVTKLARGESRTHVTVPLLATFVKTRSALGAR